MSDRYVFSDTPPPMRGPAGWAEAERIQGWEQEPLRLTPYQRRQLAALLERELGPVSGKRLMRRIEHLGTAEELMPKELE